MDINEVGVTILMTVVGIWKATLLIGANTVFRFD